MNPSYFVAVIDPDKKKFIKRESTLLMPKESKRPLKVFLCHASGDKPQVRILYKRLVAEGVDAWLDQEKLLPGQDWRVEIPRAVRESDVVVIFLSNKSITKEGYIQKEIKFALDAAEEKPEGSIFLIPARLEDCSVPEQMSRWHWVDLHEDNGFLKLLRSLKLRADKVSAVVEPIAYIEEHKEIENKLNQLYTEGLAAFYTEEWDKACQRFQSILSVRPNHKNAIKKLEEAEEQRDLSRLYAYGNEAYKLEDWQTAIKSLEELSKKSNDYKDAAQLLKIAKKQRQLKELYIEAKALHIAQKWNAVLKVFEQISIIEPNFTDTDGLLQSAQSEVEKIKRLDNLNDLYGTAVRQMEAGQWYESRRLLEQVDKLEPSFLETDRLLKKIEDEITNIEELNRRNDRVNTLYEQAHGLLRTKNWSKALDKLEEILSLDNQFVDKDGISEKAKVELLKEEEEAQRQNDLATMYVEAIRLLKEAKYQESLNKWHEIKEIDPKYPDRQWVQGTATKKLTEVANAQKNKPSRPLNIIKVGCVSFILILTTVIVAIIISPPPESNPTNVPIVFTSTVSKTNTPVTIVTPTPQSLTLSIPGFSNANVIYQDTFDESSLSGWDRYLIDASANQGFLTLTGKNSWQGSLSRSSGIQKNEAAIIEFKFSANTQFEMEISTGAFQTTSWRVWGIFGRDNSTSFDINVGEGVENIAGAWDGDLKPSPEIWYVALFHIGDEGIFIIRIWEKDKPEQYIELKKTMESNWENKNWNFGLDIFSGILIIDTYQEITLR